jgi:hypothetical protein
MPVQHVLTELPSSVKRGSSADKFFREARQEGWGVIVEENAQDRNVTKGVKITVRDPKLRDEFEADIANRPSEERGYGVDAWFYADGAFSSARQIILRRRAVFCGTDDLELDHWDAEESGYRVSKFTHAFDLLAHGPTWRFVRAREAAAKDSLEAERRAEAVAALVRAAETEEVTNFRSVLDRELDYATRGARDALEAIRSRADAALAAIEAGEPIEEPFGDGLFGGSTGGAISQAIAKSARRNDLLKLERDLGWLFDGPKDES